MVSNATCRTPLVDARAETGSVRHGGRDVSSIRPLATITLLAAVGMFLYLKINESEPPLPADIAEWAVPEQVEIDGLPAAPGAGSPFRAAPAGSSAPAFNVAPQASEAPAFSPNLATPPPAFAEAPPRGETTIAGAGIALSDVPDLPPLPSSTNSTSAIVGQVSPAHGHDHDHGADRPMSPSNASGALEIAAMQNPPQSAFASASQPLAQTGAIPQAQASLFSATRLAVQAALDRGELSQALLLLSDWYGDPSLSASESQEVSQLLSQLAGSVIYSTEHRLEPPHMVQAGEKLEDIAKQYNIPWQLLAKINGIARADQLQPGQQLKVMRGPFSALIDLSERKMTLMLDRRYAGQFSIHVDPTTSVEEGHWTVDQKLLTPGNAGLLATATTPTEEHTLMLTNPTGGGNQVAILRAERATTPTTADPTGRVIHLKSSDVEDVFDILSLGSRVTIRR